MSGVPSQTSRTNTLGELQMNQQLGSMMFDRQVASIAQSLNGMMEYVRYLFQHHAGKKGHQYVSKEKIHLDRAREDIGELLRVKSMGSERFKGLIVTTVRTRMTDLKRVEMLQNLDYMGQKMYAMKFPALQSPKFQYEWVMFLRDYLNIEKFPLPSLEELYQEKARMEAQAKEMEKQQNFEKILKSVENSKLRSQLMDQANTAGLIPGNKRRGPSV